MTTSTANWTGLFQPKGASYDDLDEGVEIHIDDWEDEVTEVTADMLVAMPSCEDEDEDEDIYSFDDVTEDLVPLDALAADQEEEDDEERSSNLEAWPRSYEEHKRHLERATRDDAAAEALAIFGMGDVRGSEDTAAAIAKAWEDLRFWEPMLEMGRTGDFTGHLADLRKCAALLEAHPPQADKPTLLEKWEQARAEIRRNLPEGKGSGDLAWQRSVAGQSNARVSIYQEEVA